MRVGFVALIALFSVIFVLASSCDAAPPRRPAKAAEAARDRREQPTADDPAATEVWQVLYLGKDRIGYSHTLSRPSKFDGRPSVHTETEMRISLKRFAQSLQMETKQEFEETPEGGLLSFAFEIKNPPAGSTRASGRVQEMRLVGRNEVAGTVREYSLLWQANVKTPAYLERLPRSRRFKLGDNLSYQVFLPEQMQISDVRVTAGRPESVTLLNGRRRTLQKMTTLQSVLPQAPVQSFLDDRGETLVSTTEMLGQTLTAYTVPPDEALKEVAGQELDIAVNTLVRTGLIPFAHRTKKAVYRVHMRGEDPSPFFVNGGNQKVIRTGPEDCEITVHAVPLAGSNRSTRVDRQYLASSRYLQTTDPDVMRHAERAALGSTEPVQIARAMEKYVNREVHKKDFSTALASAAEVARTLQGDCTEHAVLLAAMLRARGIPSRIAVGLVYVETLQAFAGHMWTEAWLGDHWVPLDAMLGLGGIGAAHLTMAETSFADNGPAPYAAFLPLMRVLGRIEITVDTTSLESGR